MNLRGSLLVTLGIAFASVTFGQKNNETSAAVERKNARSAMFSQDMEGAKKSFLAAKEYVDLALAHPDTKESQKTLWLAGDIYASLAGIMAQTGDMEGVKSLGEDPFQFAHDCFKKGYGLGKKYQGDIEESVNMLRTNFDQAGGMMYSAEQFAFAAIAFETQAKMASAINVVDTTAIFNSAISYNQAKQYEKAAEKFSELVALGKDEVDNAVSASQAFRELEKYDDALAITEKANTKFPGDQRLLTEMVNTNLAKGDNEAAQKTLNDAIKADPNNPVLYYVIGSIYMELKKKEEAEQALVKALELKPDYPEVQYQLGVHLYYWSEDIYVELNNLDRGDPKADEMAADLENKRKEAIVNLEKYLETDPKNRDVIDALRIIYYKLGNTEKYKEYKERLDSL